MAKVVGDISMSLDGFVTGPDPDPEHGLGEGGDGIHSWVFSSDAIDRAGARRVDRRDRRGDHGPADLSTSWTDRTAGPTRWATAPREAGSSRSSW